MKNAPLGDGAQGKHSRDADKPNIASRSSCPYAPECHRHWIYITGTETADCAHCYQNLSRSDMARILDSL